MSKVIKSSNAKTIDSNQVKILLKEIHKQITTENAESTEEVNLSPLNQEVIEQSRREAIRIQEQAQLEYQQLQEQMRLEYLQHEKRAEQLLLEAERNGYNDGFQQGLNEGQKQFHELIEQAKDVVNASKRDYLKKLEDSEPLMIELAVKVARKIISNTINCDQQAILSIVKEVLNVVREQEMVKIYVHPNWYETVLTYKNELQLLVQNNEELYIYPDDKLEENGCVIETSFGKIDASLDSQLSEIKYALLEKLKEHTDERS
ncbi:MAG: flagellar assembly protein FliH [Bacillaceae bacterium]|nr:flagellar assembly protein FliH [Bacillaceae bacterium]